MLAEVPQKASQLWRAIALGAGHLELPFWSVGWKLCLKGSANVSFNMGLTIQWIRLRELDYWALVG